MSKYIDLADRIASELGGYAEEHRVTLAYLDRYPGLVPGRTITESESKDLFNTARRGLEYWPDALERTGITVVPEPEPTNVEKLETALRRAGIGKTLRQLAEYLDYHGVNAPGADDD